MSIHDVPRETVLIYPPLNVEATGKTTSAGEAQTSGGGTGKNAQRHKGKGVEAFGFADFGRGVRVLLLSVLRNSERPAFRDNLNNITKLFLPFFRRASPLRAEKGKTAAYLQE